MSEVKERPDSPGLWWREDGAIHVWASSNTGQLFWVNLGTDEYSHVANLPPGRWLKADLQPPEFPQLPERPKLVYANARGLVAWWVGDGVNTWTSVSGLAATTEMMEVIPHPDNDPEAVAEIERARNET